MARFHATPDGLIPFTAEEELERDSAEAKAILEAEAYLKIKYQRDRAAEYPPITDYIDGVVKGDQAQVQAYIDACLAIKAKYPKP
jgi:hypothetical protein